MGPAGRGSSMDGDELAAGERRDTRPDEHIVDRDGPDPGRAGHHDPCPEHEQSRDGVGRRRGVADVPGQRRPVPDLDRPDDGRRLGQRLVVAPDPLVGDDVGHHRPRADRQPGLAGVPDLRVELLDPFDIDHDPRPDGPVAEPDDQVRPTRQRTRIGPVLGEQGDSVVEMGRSLVREGSHRRA